MFLLRVTKGGEHYSFHIPPSVKATSLGVFAYPQKKNACYLRRVRKPAEAWRRPPTQSTDEVKKRVELYLYSPSGPSGPVQR
jgi:hypothetical protein